MKKAIAIIVSVACVAFTLTTLGIKCAGKIQDSKPAKYIFLFIGDGMGHAQASLAESYLSYQEGTPGNSQLLFTTFPVLGTCFTYSASSLVTDSSAAGTAIATGTKTNNSYLGVDPDGNPVYSFADDLKEMGYNIGIYSSVPVNHATPASFYGHNISRNGYYEISKDMIPADYNFYGGANFLQFKGKEGEPNTEEYLEANGYQVAFGQAEFDEIKSTSDRVVLLAEPRTKQASQYVSDEAENQETMLLADMTRNCLDFLGDEKPFFIMCEGGEIDYMCHADKTMPTVEAIYKFNDAIQVAYDFYLKHPKQTLIVVTADHETGGLTLGAEPLSYAIDWAPLEKQWLEAGQVNDLSPEENRTLNESCGIAWTTTHHTGAPVPIYAIGKGAQKFAGRMNNIDISKKILCAE